MDELGFLSKIFSFLMFLLKILKVIFKIALFMGCGWLLLPIGIGVVYEIIAGHSSPIVDTACGIMIYICIVPAVLTCIQNVVRMVKKDRSFSILQFFMGKANGKKGFEAKLGGDTVM